MNPAIFFDRDGVINKDFGYVCDMTRVEWVDYFHSFYSVFPTHFKKFIVTNQAGIARGLYTESEFRLFMSKFLQALEGDDIYFHEYRYCPHHPDFNGQCACRKPAPKMLLDLKLKFKIDMSQSYMIGDKETDCFAGVAAGVKYNFLIDENRSNWRENFYNFESLRSAAKFISSQPSWEDSGY